MWLRCSVRGWGFSASSVRCAAHEACAACSRKRCNLTSKFSASSANRNDAAVEAPPSFPLPAALPSSPFPSPPPPSSSSSPDPDPEPDPDPDLPPRPRPCSPFALAVTSAARNCDSAESEYCAKFGNQTSTRSALARHASRAFSCAAYASSLRRRVVCRVCTRRALRFSMSDSFSSFCTRVCCSTAANL